MIALHYSHGIIKCYFKIAQNNYYSPSDINSKIRSVDLPESITNLHRQPLQEINIRHDIFEEDSTGGSPMSLDKSGILSTPIKRSKSAQELLLDVDEYREEIYLYLREAEVCK
jgi:hypothetical protein